MRELQLNMSRFLSCLFPCVSVRAGASASMLRFWSTTDDQRAGAGAPGQPVDVGGPVLEAGPEDHLSVLVEAARAVRPLPDVDPQVGNGGPDRFAHGVSSPLSRPESAEATPTLPGRGPDRARHISISRFPRAVPPRWQHPRALYGAGADGHPGRSVSDHRYGPIVMP